MYHVLSILIDEMDVEDPIVLAAGALHDVVEDCGISISELEKKFGGVIASIVESESENMFNNRRHYMEHFGKAQKRVLLIKTADRIDNLRFISHRGVAAFRRERHQKNGTWGTAKAVEYVIETKRYIAPYSKKASRAGHRELNELLTKLEVDDSA